ncbi:recombinase family protein [Desulfosporosinus metallidurans]|uniref:recombinase family protein n=1 Tax=Desulfosporosinus metallidurans TaxID=1888891 RepID=UPI00094D6EFA|nr:recombinase family protein [Desulfosporosinus metallidurans]
MPRIKKTVSIIPPNPAYNQDVKVEEKKLRVAAYCRVSTELEEQQSSYQTQVEHYTREIQNNPKWIFAGIYADEGISGTNTKKRVDFNRMIEDCLASKIDMVLTKSVSRFARNTVDCITYIRQLKEKNIAVFFEKENINTLDGAGELLITILGSLAQEESRSLSTNTRWGIARRFENGQVYLNHNRFLGYTKNQEGELVIVPEEAEVVKLIFRLYLEGNSCENIKKQLEEKGIKSPTGKNKWYSTTISHMLSNEKYMGDALLQKSYTTDFINKTRVKNNGIVPQYYVEGSHEAIISKELWNLVQEEKARRNNIRKSIDKRATTDNGKYSSKYALSDLMICGECGKPYRRATWTKTKEKRIVWRCFNRQEYGNKYCHESPTIDEYIVHDAIRNAINLLIDDKDEFISTLTSNIIMVMGKYSKVIDVKAMDERLEQLKTAMFTLVEKNAKSGKDDMNFDQEYEKIAEERKQILKAKNEYTEQKALYDTYSRRVSEMQKFLGDKKCTMAEFDNELVRRLIQSIKIISEDKMIITFKSGIEMEQTMEVREKYKGCGQWKRNKSNAKISACL